MRYYSVEEVVGELEQFKLPKRKVYKLLQQIEETTPHRFGKMFRGHYYRTKERKEKVVSKRDLLLLEKVLKVIATGKNKADVIQRAFGVSDE